jgi:ribonuclease HI
MPLLNCQKVEKLISVYADGSSGGRKSTAIGWGWAIVIDGVLMYVGSGGSVEGTNNIAELTAAIRGLEALAQIGTCFGEQIELVSDSTYVLGLANGSFSATKNIDLAGVIRSLIENSGASTRWVKGHSGEPFNEICDKLAKAAKQKLQPLKTSNKAVRRKNQRERVKSMNKTNESTEKL